MASGKHQKSKLTSQTLLVYKHSGVMHLEVSFMGKSFIWRFPVLLGFSSIKSNKTAVVVFWVIPACSHSWDWDVYIIAQEGCGYNSARMGAHRCKASDILPHSTKSPRRGGRPVAPLSLWSLGVPSEQHSFLERKALPEAIYVLLYVVLIQKKNAHPNPRGWLKHSPKLW